MNYAWANPSTGIREQADTAEEARLRAWEELQPYNPEDPTTVLVYEQERIGEVGPTSATLRDPEEWNGGYAWASPKDAKRHFSRTWKIAISLIRDDFPPIPEVPAPVPARRSFWDRIKRKPLPPDQSSAPPPLDIGSVIVYRQRLAFSVRGNDPRPADPTPSEAPADTPSAILAAIQKGEFVSQEDLSRASTMALLWIAEALQKVNPK